jgi:hypothetical protein
MIGVLGIDRILSDVAGFEDVEVDAEIPLPTASRRRGLMLSRSAFVFTTASLGTCARA